MAEEEIEQKIAVGVSGGRHTLTGQLTSAPAALFPR